MNWPQQVDTGGQDRCRLHRPLLLLLLPAAPSNVTTRTVESTDCSSNRCLHHVTTCSHHVTESTRRHIRTDFTDDVNWRHKTQRSTQKALDRRYPGLVGYVNSGLHPRSRRQSTMAICCVGVSGLQSPGMRKKLVVVVVNWRAVSYAAAGH